LRAEGLEKGATKQSTERCDSFDHQSWFDTPIVKRLKGFGQRKKSLAHQIPGLTRGTPGKRGVRLSVPS
jgi:hypothetical protein